MEGRVAGGLLPDGLQQFILLGGAAAAFGRPLVQNSGIGGGKKLTDIVETARPGQINLAADQALGGQAVDFPAGVAAQEFGEIGFGHSPFFSQSLQGGQGRIVQAGKSGGIGGDGGRLDLGTGLVFESGRQKKGGGGKEGTEVVTAEPLGQIQSGGIEQGGRLDRLQDVFGFGEIGYGGQFQYDALDGTAAKRHPNQLPRNNFPSFRDMVGKGAAGTDRGIHGYFGIVEHNGR